MSDGAHLTPYDDAYPTCERTLAELRIYSGEMPPEEVTRRLGIEPTKTRTSGQKVVSGVARREREVRTNGWFLSSENAVASLDFRRHLDWLLERLAGVDEALHALQAEPGVRMTVTGIWWSVHAQGGPTLWPRHMQRLSELNLECGFDISFYADEEEEE